MQSEVEAQSPSAATNPSTLNANEKILLTDQTLTDLAGPAWNNSTEYAALSSIEFDQDRQIVEASLTKLSEIARKLALSTEQATSGEPSDDVIRDLQAFTEIHERTATTMNNLSTFVSCERSTDGSNQEAMKLGSELTRLSTKLNSISSPVWLYLARASEETLKRFFDHPQTVNYEFYIQRKRERIDTLLSDDEETLILELESNGPQAWGDLYNQISTRLRCKIGRYDGSADAEKDIGLAQASGMLRDSDESKRRAAYLAIQDAWKEQETSGAAILNALAGWRLDVDKRRSKNREIDFLDQALFNNRVKRETLEAMMGAIQDEIEIPRRALSLVARAIGKPVLDPWDLLAGPPDALRPKGSASKRPYCEGVELVRSALASVDSELGEFVSMMDKNCWIEGRSTPNKRQGAFCTQFAKSRTPRVYMTYLGSGSDLRTLAHELGHAYHAWVMRDLPRAKSGYPSTLAETASVFAETALSDRLAASDDPNSRLDSGWQNVKGATSFLLNIPARFDFESSFYEKRRSTFVTASELGDLTEAAWKKWYGDALSTPDRQFWMTKLHFSLAGTRFYNFPYAFGYLFSLGIYALREEAGPQFMKNYVSLLRDTGTMTAEDLALKHLGVDLSKADFWKKSLSIVRSQIDDFEMTLAQSLNQQ